MTKQAEVGAGPEPRRPSLPLVLSMAAAGLGLILLLVALPTLSQGIGFGFDFACYYDAAVRLIAGQSIYLPHTIAGPFIHGGPGTYVYPPPLAVGLIPLGLLDGPTATVAWYVLRIAALAGACALIPTKPWVRYAAFAVTAFSAPFLSDQSLGNVNALLLLLLAIAWRWLDRPASAVAVAASIAIRPQLILIAVWWALRQRWTMVAWCVGAGLVLILVTLPFVGVSTYLDFIRLLTNIRFEGSPNNVSISAMASDLGLPSVVGSVAFVIGAIVALAAVVASRRREPELGFVVGVAATLLVTPLFWPHYLVLIVLPAAYLADRGRWWAIGLPLLGWLPAPFLPLIALAGVLCPFLARSVADDQHHVVADLRP